MELWAKTKSLTSFSLFSPWAKHTCSIMEKPLTGLDDWSEYATVMVLRIDLWQGNGTRSIWKFKKTGTSVRETTNSSIMILKITRGIGPFPLEQYHPRGLSQLHFLSAVGTKTLTRQKSASGSGQTETVSVQFRPKISACFGFGFGISVFSLFGVSAETLFSAETACFGQFWMHISV